MLNRESVGRQTTFQSCLLGENRVVDVTIIQQTRDDAEKCRPSCPKSFWKPRTCESEAQRSMIKLPIIYVYFSSLFLYFSDMQQLKLSRSDNPYIQKKLASRDEINMIDIDETADDDTNLIPSLMSQESDNDDFFDVISHDHLIRSPPPVFRPIGSTFNFPSIDDGDETDDYHFPHFPEKQRANSTPKTHYTNSTRSSLSELKFA